jgi:hypothetical protein
MSGFAPRVAWCRCAGALLLVVGFSSAPRAADADTAAAEGVVASVFSIAKSQNKNQVQYAVRLDPHCVPAGSAPVFAYWRMLELGPTQTAPLLSREVEAYGLASQDVLSTDPSGGKVRAVLKALPSRPLTIATWRGSDHACHAAATMSIAGAPAHLFSVYVHLKWDGVDYLLLQGWSMDGAKVRETLRR